MRSVVCGIAMGMLMVFLAGPVQGETACLINYQSIKNINEDENWKPLSSEDVKECKQLFAFKLAGKTAELADSLHMNYISEKMFDIIDLGRRFIDKRERFKDKFHIKVKIDREHLFLTYKRRY